ncbi:hypothetical protein IJ182_10220 [bacterium]|nr:hypothetical protein [bacterium]
MNVVLDTSTSYDYNTNPATPYMALAGYKENVTLIRSIESNYLNAYALGFDENDTISLDTDAEYDVNYGNGTDYNHRMLHIKTTDGKSLYIDGYFAPATVDEEEISSSNVNIKVNGETVDLSEKPLGILNPTSDFDANTFLANVPFEDVVIGTNTLQNKPITLNGGDGDDVINSQFTKTTLSGGEGADTFRYDYTNTTKYNSSHNNDIIKDATSEDNILFTNSKSEDFTYSRSGDNLVISSHHIYNWSNGNGKTEYDDSVTLENFFTNENPIDTINFEKDKVISPYSILDDATINVTVEGDYTSTAYKENITLTGENAHTLTFKKGDGTGVVNGITFADKIIIDVEDAALTYTRDVNNLVINYTDNDSVTLKDYFNANNNIDSKTAFQNIEVKSGEGYTAYNLLEQTIKVSVNGNYEAPNINTDGEVTGGFNEDIQSVGATTGDGYKIYANDGNDILRGSNESEKVGDWLEGGEGDDIIYGGSAATIIRESEKETSKNYAYNMLAGNMGKDTIYGSEGVDRIYGGDADADTVGDELYGLGGNDVVKGAKGDDTIVGGTGDDELTGRGGKNLFIFSKGDGNDTITDATIEDTIKFDKVKSSALSYVADGTDLVIKSGEDSVTVKGYYTLNEATNLYEISQNAIDTVVASDKTISLKNVAPLIYDLHSNINKDVQFNEFLVATEEAKDVTASKGKNSWIQGGSYDNVIKGNSGYNVLAGDDGNDTINGGTGFNEIYAGRGKDSITGGNAGNYIWGDGLEADNATMMSSDENDDFIKGGKGNDTIFGGAGTDRWNIVKSGNDTIYGTAGNNTIWGGDGDDAIYAGTGSDTIGYTLYKDFGNDTIYSASKKDTLYVRTSTDALAAEFELADAADDAFTYSRTADSNDLLIRTANGTITLDKFFTNKSSENIDKINISGAEDAVDVSIAKQNITVALNADGTYKGTDYNEVITVDSDEAATLTMGKGENTINVTLKDSAQSQIINVTKGEKLNINIPDTFTPEGGTAQDIKQEYIAEGNDLLINSYYNVDENTMEIVSTIVIKNAAGKNTGAEIIVNDINLDTVPLIVMNEFDVTAKGKLTGSTLADDINLAKYQSLSAKGVNVNSKSGNDSIVGSNYNDTIKSGSLAGEIATIEEYAGTNKITTGNGDDVITARDYSSNNINAGAGDNKITLMSTGKNTVKAANGDNEIWLSDGSNNVKLGNGANDIIVYGGVNTVKTGKGDNVLDINEGLNKFTTGKGQDTFNISAGNNTINSGAGGDIYHIVGGQNKIKAGNGASEFVITDSYEVNSHSIVSMTGNGGLNNITTGSKVDTFNISAGNNTINSGAGKDEFTLAGGVNIIKAGAGNDTITFKGGSNYVDGGKGADTYKADLTAETGIDFADTNIIISDKVGKNILDLTVDATDKVNIFFDVDVKTGKKGKVSAKYGEMVFTTDDGTSATEDFDDIDGITVVSKKSISTLTINGTSTTISTKQLDKLAADVANWLNDKGYASTGDVFMADKTDDVTALIGKYTTFADNGYKMA